MVGLGRAGPTSESSPLLLVSTSGVLGCEEAATEQTNRACEDRKQLQTTRPRLLSSGEGECRGRVGHTGQLARYSLRQVQGGRRDMFEAVEILGKP